jgi:hypothetical protein
LTVDYRASRPPDVDAAFLAEADAEMELFKQEQRRGELSALHGLRVRVPEDLLDHPVLREVWYAGAWLGQQLDAAGCPLPERKELCVCHGRLSVGRDPWACARSVLDSYRQEGG